MRVIQRSVLFCLFVLSTAANAKVITINELAPVMNAIMFSDSQNPMALIDWKVGDSQDQQVTLTSFGMKGTLHKEAFKEEGNGIWVRQEMTLPIMNDKSEVLYDRDSGKILRYIHNGKDESIPEGNIEIIGQTREVIEVPAGKFQTIHITAKSKDIKQIDLWAAPRQISLDGSAKTIMDQGQMKIEMVLTKFTKN